MLSLILNVAQSRYFTLIAKRITFRIRHKLIKRLGRIAISEYETRGSAGIASHFVTDIEVIDNFIGNTISRFIVAVLSIFGTAIILLFLHWQLALLILFMNNSGHLFHHGGRQACQSPQEKKKIQLLRFFSRA